MKHIKLFEELNIKKDQFPTYGNELSKKEKDYLKRHGCDIDDQNDGWETFEVKTDDGYFYTIYRDPIATYYNRFDSIQDLKDYLLLKQEMNSQYINLDIIKDIISETELDLSFDENCFARWAISKGFVYELDLINIPSIDKGVKSSYILQLASADNRIEDVKKLLKDPKVNPSAMGNNAFKLACYKGNIEVAKLLLEDPRVDPTTDYQETLRDACYDGNLEIVKLLLSDPRINPSFERNLPGQLACSKGHIDIVRFLIEDPRVDPTDIILTAVEKGNVEIVKLLLSKEKTNPSYNGNLCLRQAVSDNQIDILNILLKDKRIDPTIFGKDNSPSAILYYARDNGSKECLERLLKDPRLIKSISSLELKNFLDYLKK